MIGIKLPQDQRQRQRQCQLQRLLQNRPPQTTSLSIMTSQHNL